MYIPRDFAASDEQALALIRSQVLGNAVWSDAQGLQGTPLPWWLADGEPLRLQAHMPRANPLAKALAAGPLPLLISFQGPSAYVSPNWYPSKAETERMVPTWNYALVQVHGRLSLRDDPAWVHAQIDALTRQQERSQAQAWQVTDAAPGFVDQLLRVLVGAELQVERIEAKFKLGQNRAPRDLQGLMDGLQAAGDPASLVLLELTKRSV
jgi:transcriptional regulator